MKTGHAYGLALALACLSASDASAQQTAQGSSAQGNKSLPEVEVIQKQTAKQTTPAKPKPPSKKPVAPPPTEGPFEPSEATYQPAQKGVAISPLAGSELPIDKIPGSVSVVGSKAIAGEPNPNTTDVLQKRVPGIVTTDFQGNSFNQDILYHGFQSSPVNGVPQGLAVYQNGLRINEVYSDVVQWDLIPSIAIDSLAVMSNNPAFGLNAIGGALALTMKNGFTYQGGELDVMGGSFGRIQSSFQYGAKSGHYASYIALEGLREDGWRDFSESEIKRLYADLGFKDSVTELHLSFNGGKNFMGLAGSTGWDAIQERYANVFTTPQTTDNQLAMVSATASTKATETLTLSGAAYYRRFKQRHADGNLTDLVECDAGSSNPGGFCFDEDDNTTNIPGAFDSSQFYGSIDRTTTDAESEGLSLQGVERAKVLGFSNQFTLGASYDRGKVDTTASSEFGLIPENYVVQGSGIIITDEEGSVKPVNLGVDTDYFGIYIADTIDLTQRLSVTLGGRYNHAKIALEDKTGTSPDLTGSHTFERFNPEAGATYKLLPNLSAYGGYSEANRAPTPAELACADPDKPCLIESFLVADPPLKQVVARSVQAGLRGDLSTLGGKLDWSVGFFRTATTDEILNVEENRRGYFLNAGDAVRQGFDLGLDYKTSWYSAFVTYTFTDAYADSSYTLFSAANPNRTLAAGATDDDPGTISVQPGDRLALVPRHAVKLGFDVAVTSKWTFGADAILTSDRVLMGDESNLNAPLPGYQIVNLHTAYNLTDSIQIYGLVNNVFDQKYYLFGTYFNPEENKNRPGDTDPRSVMPGSPLAAYGGVKIKF